MKLSIGYVGLSHLGINYAISSTMKGFNVVCYDDDINIISSLQKKKIPFYEKNTEKNLKKRFKQFKFTNKTNDLKNCDLVFISQDVPTNLHGKSNLIKIKKLIKKIIKVIKKECNLIILCQVPPGFTRSIDWPDNKLFYQVETLIFGKAINRALFPERIIVGCQNKSHDINPVYLRYLRSFKCPIIRMKYESAEIAKISINLLLAASVTTTNILSELCENMSADWQDIIPALKLDKRIGKFSYINPGLGIAGGNIERDIVTIKDMLKKDLPPYLLLKNILENSKYMRNWVIRVLNKEKILNRKIKIGIVGATYKENTNSVKNSPAIELLQYLKKNNNISIYEPMLNLDLKNKNIKQANNLKTLIKKNKVIIFMRPWKNKKSIEYIYKNLKNKIIIDPYRVIDFKNKKSKINKYFTMG